MTFAAAGRADLAIAQLDWLSQLLGVPLPKERLASLNTYRGKSAPRKKTPEEIRAESKAGWALIHRYFSETARRS